MKLKYILEQDPSWNFWKCDHCRKSAQFTALRVQGTIQRNVYLCGVHFAEQLLLVDEVGHAAYLIPEDVD